MKKLTLKNILIVCMSICLLIGIFFAFDIDLTQTNNIADATETESETWNIIRTGYNFTIEYSMTGNSIYAQGNGKYYLVIWETGKGGSSNNPIFCGTEDSLVVKYRKTEKNVDIIHTLSGSSSKDYSKMDLSFGVFIYDSDTPYSMQKYETTPPTDWPKLYDTSLGSTTIFSKGFDFSSPVATSTNDTYSSSCEFIYKVNDKKVDKDEFFANANPSKEVSYSASGSTTIYYGTLKNAFSTLKNTGGTVTLLKDCTIETQLQIGSYSNTVAHTFILDLNNHYIFCNMVSSYKNYYGISIQDNLEIKNSSRKGGIIGGTDLDSSLTTCDLFTLSDANHLYSVKIENGTYFGYSCIFETGTSYSSNSGNKKHSIYIKDGFFETGKFILKNQARYRDNSYIFNMCVADIRSTNYQSLKNNDDITINNGEFYTGKSIFRFTSVKTEGGTVDYNQYSAGRKVSINVGKFYSSYESGVIADCDYHSRFTIGKLKNEPSSLTFNYKSKFLNDSCFFGHKCNESGQETFKFISCLLPNNSFSTDAAFPDTEWMVNLNDYKNSGFWRPYANKYLGTYNYVIFNNYKLDYRDGNDPVIVPTNDTLIEYAKLESIEYQFIFNLGLREQIYEDAPKQYFVCWSKKIDDEGYNRYGNLNDNLISKQKSYTIYYENGDFIDSEYNPIAKYCYAVWSTTNINDCSEDVRFNENYKNIQPIFTQTLTNYGPNNNVSGTLSNFYLTFDSTIITMNGNYYYVRINNQDIIIDVRQKTSVDGVYGIDFRSEITDGLAQISFDGSSSLKIYVTNFSTNGSNNTNVYGIYTNENQKLQICSNNDVKKVYDLNIYTNDLSANNTNGKTYGIKTDSTLIVESINLNLYEKENNSYTGIYVGKYVETNDIPCPYLENSKLNINCTGTINIKEIKYIDAPSFGIKYKDENNTSQIVCSIADSNKLSSLVVPYFDFSRALTSSYGMKNILYSLGMSPYVDNISTSKDSLNVAINSCNTSFKGNLSINGIYNSKYGSVSYLYHNDLTEKLTFSNVPKFSSTKGSSVKYYASIHDIIISYDGITDYAMIDDYCVEDSMYRTNPNHNFSLDLNGKFLYVNNTISLGPNKITFYGKGRIYSGVSDYNYMFTGYVGGTVRVVNQLSGTKNSNGVDISIYAGNSYLCDENVNVYIGNESIIASSTKGNGIIDVDPLLITSNVHIMSGWMKYDIVNDTSYYEDGTKVIKVSESECVDRNYPYLIVNNENFVWNNKKYSSLSKAYTALSNAYSTNPNCSKEISVTGSVYLMKNFVADTCDVTISLAEQGLNMYGFSISTKSNNKVTIVGKDSNNFASILGNSEMFSGNIVLENCRVTLTNKSQYMFVGNSSNTVVLNNCGITADNFSSYSLKVVMYGGYYNIPINSQMNCLYIYNGYFINDISNYVQHLDGVLFYTTGINVTDPWVNSVKYSCQLFSHDTVEVAYTKANKNVNYLSLSAALKAINEDELEDSFTLTLLDDTYMFSNYMTNNTIDVTKRITVVGKNPSKKYSIFLQNNYLTIKSSLSITNAIIYGQKFFYLNDSLGNIDVSLKNCMVIQNDNALDSDCIFNYSKVAESTMIVKVILQNDNYIECNKGLLYLGSDIDYKFIGDGTIYFNVNDLGRQMKVSELTGAKKIYYSYDVSKDIAMFVDNDYVSIGDLTGDYISIGATNIDYKNGLDSIYVYKTISNPQSINVASNYDINWYDATKDSFIIKNKKQLLGLAAICNGYVYGVENTTFAGQTIRLGADIDLTGINWQPISAFDGTFYGDNYKITNLYIDCMTSNNYYYGMFATYSGPLIRDLEVSGTMNISTYIDSYPMLIVGGMIGYFQSQMINCVSNVEIVFDCPKLCNNEDVGLLVGGMVGYAATSGIYNCIFKSTLTTTLPADYNQEYIFIGTIAGVFSSTQIVNTYVAKASDYCFTATTIDSQIYNSYYITKSSNKFSVYENNQINTYSDCKKVSKILDDAVFAFDKSILLDQSIELFYWDVDGGVPVFYNGPYFKLSINEKILKTCDEGFSYEPLKEGYTFEKWLRVNNDYTTAVDKNPLTTQYDATCFNSRTYYYAYFKAKNEITMITITGWTYGETANKPSAKSKFGNVKYNYAVKGTSDYSTTVPSNAGWYTLKAYVQESIEYRGAEKTFDFEIKKATYDMSGITFTDKSYEYDGIEKTITIIGFLPNGVSVSYSSNASTINKLTNVGKIEVAANFTSNNATNYNDIPSMKAMLEIYKATINMDTLRFVDTYYTYDPAATEYVINEIGTWPVGIEGITFKNSRLTNADLDANHCGSILATAKFTYDTANYNEVSDMQATLYVNTYKSFDIRFVQFVGQTYVYSKGTKRSLEIDLGGNTLPNGVTVSYINNNQENAGIYAVIAHFTAGEEIVENGKLVGYMISGERYNPINDLVAKLVINKAKHDVTAAKNSFQNKSYTYDPNTTWSLSIDSQYIPNGVTVKYLNNALKEVGSVNVVAQFVVDENNYEHIDDCYATLTVTKATYDMSGVIFENKSFTYDGALKTIKISPSSKLPEGVQVKYSIIEKQYRQDSDISDEAGAITVGSISVYAIFTGDSKNYEPIDDIVATITITKAQYNIESTVFFKNATYVYDGKIHSIYLTDKDGNPAKLPQGLNVYYSTNTLGKAGSITVTATFDGDFINYEDLNDHDKWKAVLTIEKATYDMSGVLFKDASYVFDNSSKVIEISGSLPKGVTVTYKNNKGLQVGTYKASALFKVDERNYNKIPQMEATLTITKATYDMSNIKFEDTIFVYNGEYQTIEIVGTLPNGVTVVYQHNSLKDVCETLQAIASFKILDKINYNEIPEMRANFTIIKANYDLSQIKFEDAEYIYDGLEKKIEIVGTLPNGVTVKYETNSTTNAATLTAKAIFAGDYNNYNVIPDMTATLVVNKATYNMSYIKFENVSYLYDGNEKTLEITQQLPDGVNVEYSNNVIKNSGSLLVIATFSVVDEVNYNAIPSMSATLTIEKLTYDMSSVKFENATYVYDGKEKKIEISGNLPYGVQESYSENRMVDVGVMEVTVAFRGDTVNHNPIPQMTATLTITKANYDLSTVAFNDVSVLYDGQVHMIEITGALPKGVSVVYENNSKVEPGVYTVVATISGDTYNYYSKEYTAKLTIQNTQLKNDESQSKSIAVVYAESGFTKDVSLNTGYSTETEKYSNLKTRDTKVLGYYSVTLYTEDETGNIIEYQPSECTVSGTVKVKLLLNGIDLREVEKIYHVHKDGSIEEIAFNMDMFDGLYITLELTSLSDFVFIAHDNTYKMTMIMNYAILAAIILFGLYLINTIFYILWKKKGIVILKFMVPLYRFKNKLFFKIKFNDKEILDQTSNAGEKTEKKNKKYKNNDKITKAPKTKKEKKQKTSKPKKEKKQKAPKAPKVKKEKKPKTPKPKKEKKQKTPKAPKVKKEKK